MIRWQLFAEPEIGIALILINSFWLVLLIYADRNRKRASPPNSNPQKVEATRLSGNDKRINEKTIPIIPTIIKAIPKTIAQVYKKEKG